MASIPLRTLDFVVANHTVADDQVHESIDTATLCYDNGMRNARSHRTAKDITANWSFDRTY